MRLVIQPTAEATAEWIAKFIVKSIQSANPTEDTPFVLGTTNASGSDCSRVFAKLVAECK